MEQKTVIGFSVAVLAVSLAGCATVTRGTTSQIQIQSEPSGVEARTSLGHACTTPCTISVGRREEFIVTFTKTGFATQQIEVKTQVAGEGAAGLAGNVLVGGLVGMGVDASTGATLEHKPNPVIAVMVAEKPLPGAKKLPAALPRGAKPAKPAQPAKPVAPAPVDEEPTEDQPAN